MKTQLAALLLLLLAYPLTDAAACTGIYASDGRMILAGNNEDFWLSDTKMWFVPREEGSYGRVYFGFKDKHPQGGMNEAGLFFDGFATQRCEVKESLGKEKYKGAIVDDVMARCATVDEVIEFFGRYNLEFMENFMLMFGDAKGDSVIIEGDAFLKKRGNYQVLTNFYQSRTIPAMSTCGRYKIATRMLAENPEISIDLFRRILAAVHIELISPTQYSNIYDLKNKIVYLYHFHNYENVVKIDLAAELAKGAHTVDLPTLFPDSFAFQHFMRWKEEDTEKKRAQRRDASIDSTVFNDYAGQYVVFEGVHAGMTINLVCEGQKLLARITGSEELELIPEGRDRFFQIGNYGSQDFTFSRDENGKIQSLTYEFFMRTARAKRVTTF